MNLIPDKFVDKYNLRNISNNGNVYLKITKGIYGLLKDGILKNNNFKNHCKRWLFSLKGVNFLWKHYHIPVWLTLVVDYFSFKYIGKDNYYH